MSNIPCPQPVCGRRAGIDDFYPVRSPFVEPPEVVFGGQFPPRHVHELGRGAGGVLVGVELPRVQGGGPAELAGQEAGAGVVERPGS